MTAHTVRKKLQAPKPLVVKKRPRSKGHRARAQEAEKRLALILNTVPQFIFWKDRNSVYLGCNTFFAKAAGLDSPEEIIGKTDYDLPWPHAEADAYRADDREVMERYQSKSHIIEQMQQADGSRLWVDTTKMPLTDDAGRVFGVLGVYEDITERIAMEQELKEKDAIFRTIFDIAPYSIALNRALDNRFLLVNPAFEKMAGVSASEAIGKTLREIGLQSSGESDETIQRNLAEMGHIDNARAVIQTPGGKMNHVLFSSCVIKYRGEDCTLSLTVNLTDLHQAKLALDESEARFRFLVRNSNDIILILDCEAMIRFISPAIERIAGYQPMELEETIAFTHIHPDDAERIRDLFTTSIKNAGTTARAEYRYRHKNGDWLNFEANAVNLLQNPQFQGILVNIRDITERKQAEAALRQSEKRYRSLVETTGTGFVMVDAEGRVLDANAEYVRITGHSRLEEIRGQSVLEWTAGYEKEKNARAVAQCVRDGLIRNLEIDYVDGSGRVTPIEINATLTDTDGSPRIITLCRDITERKQAEAALRQSEERFRRIFEEGPIGIATAGADFRFLRVNAAFCRMMGRTESELIKISFKDITHPEDLGRDQDQILRLQRGEIPIYRTDKRYLRGNGEVLWGAATIATVHDSNGKFRHFLAMVEDITERKRAEDAMRISEEKFRKIFQNSPASISITHFKTGTFVDFNQSFERIFGYSREVIGQSILALNIWKNPEDRTRIFSALSKTGVGHFEDLEGRRKSGEIFIANIAFSIIELHGEDHVIAIVTDVTERKRAEEELRRYRDHLEELVKERTDKLERTNRELHLQTTDLENFNKAMLSREKRVIELKEEINRLCAELKRPPAYPPIWAESKPQPPRQET
jgi:PAS domain S-box-containing protein